MGEVTMSMTKRITSVALASIPATILVAGAGVPTATAEDAAKAFDGAYRYETACASCHGANGEGISAFGPALKGNAFIQNAPAEAIITVIQQGRYNRDKGYPDYAGMPAFRNIRAGEAQALVDFMKGELQE